MGKKSKKVTVGYKYYLGVQIAACQGPVDAIRSIIIGERVAWSGLVTGNATISINQPDLFGGEKREGGVVGDVDIMMGSSSQGRNAYLQSQQGADCPGYRGLFCVLFKRFLWSSGNPYFKSPWVQATRVLAGWSRGTAWNPSDAYIGALDMNPAHVIYEGLTSLEFGMGYNPADVDDVSFMAAATTLKAEGFGLSIKWDRQSSIEDFIKSVVDTINASLRLDLRTGKYTLKLIRDDYDVEDLVNLNPDNVLTLDSFQRSAYGDAANEVVLAYLDRNDDEKSLAVQDLASIQAQGAVITTSRNYPGIRDDALAARVALRDLNTISAPLAKASLTCNRILWAHEIGDAVSLTWPDRDIALASFRIVKIDKGTLTNGTIRVDLIEDVFGLPTNAYTTGAGSTWVDPVSEPVPAEFSVAKEAPYWTVQQNVSRADMAQLQADYGFGMLMATRGQSSSPFNFDMVESPNNITYDSVATGHFSPTGLLVSQITPTQTAFPLASFYDLDDVTLDPDNGFALIDDEYMAVVSVGAESGEIVVRRGVLDTIPAPHSAGARMLFINSDIGLDPTERTDGERAYYKALPYTGLGTLNENDAPYSILDFANRASRPYPPGSFKVNGTLYPASVIGSITSSWTHRDRLSETVSLVDYTAGNIGPEAGTTYVIKLYSGVTLKRTFTAIAGTAWAYAAADEKADDYIQTLRLSLSSARDGLASLQTHDITFERYGLGFHLGESIGGQIP